MEFSEKTQKWLRDNSFAAHRECRHGDISVQDFGDTAFIYYSVKGEGYEFRCSHGFIFRDDEFGTYHDHVRAVDIADAIRTFKDHIVTVIEKVAVEMLADVVKNGKKWSKKVERLWNYDHTKEFFEEYKVVNGGNGASMSVWEMVKNIAQLIVGVNFSMSTFIDEKDSEEQAVKKLMHSFGMVRP